MINHILNLFFVIFYAKIAFYFVSNNKKLIYEQTNYEKLR